MELPSGSQQGYGGANIQDYDLPQAWDDQLSSAWNESPTLNQSLENVRSRDNENLRLEDLKISQNSTNMGLHSTRDVRNKPCREPLSPSFDLPSPETPVSKCDGIHKSLRPGAIAQKASTPSSANVADDASQEPIHQTLSKRSSGTMESKNLSKSSKSRSSLVLHTANLPRTDHPIDNTSLSSREDDATSRSFANEKRDLSNSGDGPLTECAFDIWGETNGERPIKIDQDAPAQQQNQPQEESFELPMPFEEAEILDKGKGKAGDSGRNESGTQDVSRGVLPKSRTEGLIRKIPSRALPKAEALDFGDLGLFGKESEEPSVTATPDAHMELDFSSGSTKRFTKKRDQQNGASQTQPLGTNSQQSNAVDSPALENDADGQSVSVDILRGDYR